MSLLARHHPLGIRPHYYAEDDAAHGARAQELLRQMKTRAWNLEGVRRYLQLCPDGWLTCFSQVRLVPVGHELHEQNGVCVLQLDESLTGKPGCSIKAAMDHAMNDICGDSRRMALTLSGGLDSAFVVAMLHAAGRDDIPVFTLASGLQGYCELETTRETARVLGVKELHVIETNAEEMIAAFPPAIAAAECPLFNLHPVSRWILATKLRREGYEVLITGDGADQVFAGNDPRNYLPIIGAMTREAGLELCTPFLNEIVIAAAPPPTPNKAALRALAKDVLPAMTSQGQKVPTYAPPLNVADHWRENAIHDLASRMGCAAPKPGSEPESVLWTSLGLLADFLH